MHSEILPQTKFMRRNTVYEAEKVHATKKYEDKYRAIGERKKTEEYPEYV